MAATSPPADSSPITIGYINTLTGPAQALGVITENAFRLGIADVNASGGVCGRELAVGGVEDDQAEPTLSVAAMNKLASDGETIVVGPSTAAAGLAVAPVAESLGIFQMQLTSTSETWTGRKYIYSVQTPQDVFAPAMVDYMSAALGEGSKTIGFMYINVAFGQEGYRSLQEPVKAHEDWTETVVDTWDPAGFDFTAQAARIADANPDGLFIYGGGSPADGQSLKQIREAGYEGIIVANPSYSKPHIPEFAGDAATTIVAFTPLDTIEPDDQTQTFLTAYEREYDAEPDSSAGASYDAVHIIAEAIERADCKTDPDSVSAAMDGLTYEGVDGQYNYTDTYKGGVGPESFIPVMFDSSGALIYAPQD